MLNEFAPALPAGLDTKVGLGRMVALSCPSHILYQL
jgi:hypothetical protein